VKYLIGGDIFTHEQLKKGELTAERVVIRMTKERTGRKKYLGQYFDFLESTSQLKRQENSCAG